MTDLVLSDAKFPVDTDVDAVAANGGLCGLPAAGAVVETATVDADGVVTFTGLTDDVPYALAATVDGERRIIVVRHNDEFVAPDKWSDRTAARLDALTP